MVTQKAGSFSSLVTLVTGAVTLKVTAFGV